MLEHTTKYERNGITLYLADCREVLPKFFGYTLITDPPYTIRTLAHAEEMLASLNARAQDALVLTNPEPGYIHRGRLHSLPELAAEPSNSYPPPRSIEVMQGLIALTSGLIVDPYAGTGTTLLAARNEGRRAIGIEVDKRVYAHAVSKLQA